MKIVSIKQNTKIWHEWRGKGIGASDAPTIMGDSPWSSRLQLWGEKTGILDRPPINAFALQAMERGKTLEPVARELYEKRVGYSMDVIAAEHSDYPFIRASFDGVNFEKKRFVEIKCPGQIAHSKALKGQIPDYYNAQVQQQFLVSGFSEADYFSYRPEESEGRREVLVTVKRDDRYIATLTAELIAFWNAVQNKSVPAVSLEEIGEVEKTFFALLTKTAALGKLIEELRNGFSPKKKKGE